MALKRVVQSVLLLMAAVYLVGCSSLPKFSSPFGKPKDPYADMSAEQIYDKATTDLEKKRYGKAVEAYEALDIQYPFGDYTEKAHLNIIYTYYRYHELPSAFKAADRFIRLHPRSEYLDYVYYMRGLIKSMESINFVARVVPIDLTQRDTSSTEEAFSYFNEFLSRYPNSPYAPDARARMIAMRNDFAKREVAIAEYYLKRGVYLAAANRAQKVVEHYQQTPYVYRALGIMKVSYDKLAMPELAKQADTVLRYNDPQGASTWIRKAEKLS